MANPERAFSYSNELLQPLVSDLVRKEINEGAVRCALEHEKLRGDIVNTISRRVRRVAENLKSIEVDYRQSLDKMIKVARFRSASIHISEENFPRERWEGIDCVSNAFVLQVPINHAMVTSEILHELRSLHCRPSTLRELLAFTEQHLDLPILPFFPHVALGSTWKRRSSSCREIAAVVRSFNMELRLGVSPIDLKWKGKFFFLATFEE